MGIIILVIAIFVEVAFAAYCIIRKSNQSKTRNIIRISAFAVFLIFTLLQVIQWSFRYKMLAGLLFIMAVIGAVSLIRKKKVEKEYKAKHIVCKAIAVIFLIFIADVPAILMPQYNLIEATGEYEVATATYTYTDNSRVETYTDNGEKRKVNVGFWYPKNAKGTYPLVVFSHGMFGVKISNESLFRELASHGYVVCSIDHPYQSFFTRDEDGNITIVDKGFMQDYKDWCRVEDTEISYQYISEWMKIRTGDMNLVIDTILDCTAGQNVDEVYQLVNVNKIGVCGHSMGGSAALGLGRERNDISAVMALESPYFGDILGVKKGDFIFNTETYPVPVLNIYSDSTWGKFNKEPIYTQNEKLLANTDAQAFNVYIKGAKHLSLTDLALFSPILSSMLDGGKAEVDEYHCLKTINQATLEFFDCYLKKEF